MNNRIRALLTLLLGALLAAGYRIYRSRSIQREPSPESMDSPQVAAAFNRIAAWPQMRLLRWYVARRILKLAPEGLAVDIGCGPGHMVLYLAQQTQDLELLGVDLSEEVLAQAEAAALNFGLNERVSFKQGGAQQLPVPDASVDLAFSTLSLHHWSEPVNVLDEVNRILRPGGAFLIFDLRRDMAPPFYLLLWFATRVVVPHALRNANEPLGSRNAAYTPQEATQIATSSSLSGWIVVPGPLWLMIDGRKPLEQQEKESTRGIEGPIHPQGSE